MYGCIENNLLYLKIKRANKSVRHYFSGSTGEGFQFSFSDLDILHSVIMDYVAMDTSYGSIQKECSIIAIKKTVNQDTVCFSSLGEAVLLY